MVNDLYQRVKAGETVSVQTPEGKKFDIAPAYWHNIILGFDVVVDGQVVPTHKGLMLDRQQVDAWASDLIEVK